MFSSVWPASPNPDTIELIVNRCYNRYNLIFFHFFVICQTISKTYPIKLKRILQLLVGWICQQRIFKRIEIIFRSIMIYRAFIVNYHSKFSLPRRFRPRKRNDRRLRFDTILQHTRADLSGKFKSERNKWFFLWRTLPFERQT